MDKDKPFIYICSPLRGDIERNIQRAVGYSRFVFGMGGVPLAPHVIFTAFLDDNIPAEREAGLELGLQLMRRCDELWVFGSRVSAGMAMEIENARRRRMPIKYFNDRCEEEPLCLKP